MLWLLLPDGALSLVEGKPELESSGNDGWFLGVGVEGEFDVAMVFGVAWWVVEVVSCPRTMLD